MSEISLLSFTAASVALVHTLLGPDHYLPFAALAKARAWSVGKTIRITLICGLGHIVGSIFLGVFGVAVGAQLASLEIIESTRADLAAWGVLTLGLVYLAWGLRKAWHPATKKCCGHSRLRDSASRGTFWGLFIVFVLGPCELLIPLLMYPAATGNVMGAVIVSSVFGAVTVLTMLAAVIISVWGLRFIKVPAFERFSHALAGSTIVVCGASMLFLGL